MAHFKDTREKVSESFFGGLADAARSIPGSVRQSRDDELKRKLVTFEALQGIQRDEQRRQEFRLGMERLNLNFLKTKFQQAKDAGQLRIGFENLKIGQGNLEARNRGLDIRASEVETKTTTQKPLTVFQKNKEQRNRIISLANQAGLALGVENYEPIDTIEDLEQFALDQSKEGDFNFQALVNAYNDVGKQSSNKFESLSDEEIDRRIKASGG